MDKLSRRSFLRRRLGLPKRTAQLSGISEEPVLEGTSRRAFLQGGAGAAAGAALVLATPKVAAIAIDAPGSSVPAATRIKPSGPVPYEPVTAYVRNAEHGEVTVMSGKRETTYRDPVLVKRLLDAAR